MIQSLFAKHELTNERTRIRILILARIRNPGSSYQTFLISFIPWYLSLNVWPLRLHPRAYSCYNTRAMLLVQQPRIFPLHLPILDFYKRPLYEPRARSNSLKKKSPNRSIHSNCLCISTFYALFLNDPSYRRCFIQISSLDLEAMLVIV